MKYDMSKLLIQLHQPLELHWFVFQARCWSAGALATLCALRSGRVWAACAGHSLAVHRWGKVNTDCLIIRGRHVLWEVCTLAVRRRFGFYTSRNGICTSCKPRLIRSSLPVTGQPVEVVQPGPGPVLAAAVEERVLAVQVVRDDEHDQQQPDTDGRVTTRGVPVVLAVPAVPSPAVDLVRTISAIRLPITAPAAWNTFTVTTSKLPGVFAVSFTLTSGAPSLILLVFLAPVQALWYRACCGWHGRCSGIWNLESRCLNAPIYLWFFDNTGTVFNDPPNNFTTWSLPL